MSKSSWRHTAEVQVAGVSFLVCEHIDSPSFNLMGRSRNLMMKVITITFAMTVWLPLLMLCDASRTGGIYVTPAMGQIEFVDRQVADVSPNSYGDLLHHSRLAGNIMRFFKINSIMLRELIWSSILTVGQRDGVSSSTSLNQDSLSRRILRRRSPPTSYPPPGVTPFNHFTPAPSPGPLAFY